MAQDDTDFRNRAEHCLAFWLDVFEESEGFDELELIDGVLQAETEDGRTFVLNRHNPLRQVWLSSPVSGAHHYAFDGERDGWFSTRGGEAMTARLVADLAAVGIEVGENV
ncbi:iron donor protein CyaY [Zavarzinia aquatilis]|uniref:Iron donor protein CyaY n=1 Tax=Zavarzinia aquatilis TaxID=2211142 RepID=A0A317EGX2_9PROT|nr:iron donor protein CyaY [Zavarzinia aquatilis]PWR24465.1 iron donor protein CyaY [Zavarzinia aquatilis]